MKVRIAGMLMASACLALAYSASQADDVKSGPEAGKKTGGAFNVKAITGGQAGKTLCYV
jgi:hypothetical protein